MFYVTFYILQIGQMVFVTSVASVFLYHISVFCALQIGAKFSKFQNFPVKASASLPAKTVFVSLHFLFYFHWSVSQYKVTAIAFYNICLWRSLIAHVKTTLLSICELFIIKQIS